MKSKCIDAVNQAVGREVSEAELASIETRLQRHLRENAASDPQGTLALSPEQRLLRASQTAAAEFKAEQAKKAQRTAIQIAVNARIANHLEVFGTNRLDGLARLVAFHADTQGRALSAESRAEAIAADSLRQMLGTLEASNPHFFGLFENAEGVRALVRELHGEDSGVAAAKAGAKEFHAITETLRTRFNRNGGDVGRRDDWGMPHHHSQAKVAQAGRDAWVNDILPALDRARYYNGDGAPMSEAQLREFLGQAHLSIATDGANQAMPGQPGGLGMRANRGSAHRQLHFKDADSYLAYQAKYGELDPYSVLVRHVQGIAKDIALVETFGPNPDHTFRLFLDQARNHALTETSPTGQLSARPGAELGKVNKQADDTARLYRVMAGQQQPVASLTLARNFDRLRNALIASRLGSAVISSFSDEATIHLTARINNLPAMRVFANALAALNPANATEKRLALRAGLALDSMIGSLQRFGQDGLGAAFSRKLATANLRASGLLAITEARKRAFGTVMMDSLGSLTRQFDDLGKLDPHDHRILLSKGITGADWAVWRKARTEAREGNATLLTPDAIYLIPDADLAGLGADARVLKENAATRLLGITLEETNMAVITPGVRERAFMGGDTQRGTWKGELTRSFFLFKSFPLAMITRHFMRGMDQPAGTGKAAYLATLFASTTVLGALSLQVNEMLSGRDPRNLADDGYLGVPGLRFGLAAMLKGGSLGLYGDFLFSESTRHGNSPVASFMGPAIGFGESLFNLTQGNVLQAMAGQETHAGAELVKFGKGVLPGASLWYGKAAFDHLVFHQMQEYFSPGYLDTVRRRSYREYGQRYWWEPGEFTPERAPDLGAMAGD